MELPKIVALGIYDSNIAKPNTVISKNRKVTMFEIELPIEDSGISYVDSSYKKINSNMIICAKPGQIRHTKFPFKCFYIHMIVQPGVLYDILTKTPVFFEPDDIDRYKQIFSEMTKYYSNFSEIDDIIIHSKLLEIIYLINNHLTIRYGAIGLANNTSVIEKTINYIDNHLTDDLSLNKLSALNSISPIYFHNIFRSSTGKTVRKYVEEQRIKKAINLLLTTNLTLTQIAYESGFSSQSYFSYAFKRKMQCSPREYVKKINNKYEL